LHLPSNRIYEEYFMLKLRARFRTKVRLFPDHFDVDRLQGVGSLRQFDDRVTASFHNKLAIGAEVDVPNGARVSRQRGQRLAIAAVPQPDGTVLTGRGEGGSIR
jgi:hypothetical protein